MTDCMIICDYCWQNMLCLAFGTGKRKRRANTFLRECVNKQFFNVPERTSLKSMYGLAEETFYFNFPIGNTQNGLWLLGPLCSLTFLVSWPENTIQNVLSYIGDVDRSYILKGLQRILEYFPFISVMMFPYSLKKLIVMWICICITAPLSWWKNLFLFCICHQQEVEKVIKLLTLKNRGELAQV